MEKVRAFDSELWKLYEYEIQMNRLVCYFFGFFAAVIMIFATTMEFGMLSGLPVVMYMMAVTFYLRPFVTVSERRSEFISIYEKLRYAPVSKREIVAVRLEYLRRYCIPMSIVNLLMGLLGMLIEKQWKPFVILYTLGVSGVVVLTGAAYILWPTWWDVSHIFERKK